MLPPLLTPPRKGLPGMRKFGQQTKRRIPYDPQRPASEAVFVGREHLLSQLIESCSDLHSYGLIGEPGIGKTSLLLALERSLLTHPATDNSRILIPVYLEFYSPHLSSVASILEAILIGFTRAIEAQTGLAYPLIKRRDLEQQAANGRFEQPFSNVLDWYYLEAHRLCQMVLLFDDLHRGKEFVWLNEALSILRPTVSNRKDMSIVLSGELPLEKEFRNDVSPLRNLVAGQINLGVLLPEETGSLVRVARDFEWEVEAGCESLAHDLTQGHPYKLHYYLLEAIKTHGTISRLALEAVHNNQAKRAYLESILKKNESPVAAADRAELSHSKLESHRSDRLFVDFVLQVASNGHINVRSPQGEVRDKLKLSILKKITPALEAIDHGGVSAQAFKVFGQALYDLLLPNKVHTHFEKTEAAARSANAKVRLRMQIDHDTVASLPLEFMYRQSLGYFLALNPDTVLSRYLDLPLPGHRVRRRDGPLHLLVIISDPSDQTRLNPKDWENILHVALASQINKKDLTIEVVRRATRKKIRDALLNEQPDIIQFIGHGVYHDGRGYLALVNEDTGKTWLVNDETFANIFLGTDGHLGLVSLMTCDSAKSDSPQGFIGIAPKIVQRGVPAVVAMQYPVRIQTAKFFLEDFYTAIAAHNPIDWAVQEGRKAISLEMGLDNREFATPVLYMRAEDGMIFQ